VSALAERCLKILVYLAHLFACRINHTLTPAMIPIDEIRHAQVLMEHDAAHCNPTENPKIADIKAMMEFLEDPDSYLSVYTGEGNVPFPYIYRPTVDPSLEALDLCMNYTTVDEQI
jgi:hypothetical protein